MQIHTFGFSAQMFMLIIQGKHEANIFVVLQFVDESIKLAECFPTMCACFVVIYDE